MFPRFWAGEAVSELGSWISLLALPAVVVTALRLADGTAEPSPRMDLATSLVVRESTAPRAE